jgi:DNA polymerase III epsilon subunit-like protein
MLARTLARASLVAAPVHVACTAQLWRARHPGSVAALDFVSAAVGTQAQARGLHGALEDAVLAARLLMAMLSGDDVGAAPQPVSPLVSYCYLLRMRGEDVWVEKT